MGEDGGVQQTQGLFDGVGVALVTLFDRAGGLDAKATAEHAARLADQGVRGIAVAGSTGEAASLEPDERSQLVTAVRAAVPDDVAVLAGTGAPATRQAAALTRRAADDGADAVLVLSPPGAPDPRPYYAGVAEAATVPVLAYHFPGMSAPGIPLDAVRDLPVAGVKDSSGQADRLAVEIEALPGGTYVGSPAVLLQARAMGCRGAILAVANLDPDGCRRAWEGDGAAQRTLLTGHRAGALSGIAGLKRALCELYGTSPTTRLG
jgi:4-hydroxy-tetrahydrodipicolinate synthase